MARPHLRIGIINTLTKVTPRASDCLDSLKQRDWRPFTRSATAATSSNLCVRARTALAAWEFPAAAGSVSTVEGESRRRIEAAPGFFEPCSDSCQPAPAALDTRS